MRIKDPMIPDGYHRIVVADTQRAMQWEQGLKKQGIEALRLETSNADVMKGTWMIVVPASEELSAKAYVAAVLNGRQTLPSSSNFPAWGLNALIGVGVVVLLLCVLAGTSC